MDPSIMKLLEEDEDETMHSGADVDAFQAALNRDIVGDASTSQPSDSDTVLSCEIKQSPSQPFLDWQTTSQGENASGPSQQQQQQEQHISVTEIKQHGSAAENQQLQNNVRQMSSHLSLHQKELQDDVQQGQTQQMSIQTPQLTGMEISERNSMSLPELEKMQNLDTGSQYLKIKKMVTQQATATEQPGNLKNQVKPIPFMLLLPTLNSHLDKDREMQLQTLFNKMRKNEIKNEQFVRLMRSIAGEQVFKLALEQVQLQMQSQAFAHQSITRTPGASASSAVQVHADYPSAEKSVQKPREVYCQPDSHGMQTSSSSSASIVNQDRERPSIPVPGHRKQQQHLHFPQSSFLMHGNNTATYHPYSGANVYTSGSPMKQQPHDLQIRKSSHQTMGAIRMGGSTHTMNIMNMPKFERKNSITDPSRLQKGSISQYTNKSALQQSSVPWQAPTNKQVLVEQATEQPYKSQLSNPQSLSATLVDQGNAVPGNMKDESLEKHPSKVGFSPPTSMVPSNSVSPSIANKLDPNVPVGSQIPSVASSAGVNAKTPPKKPSVAQKKPLEALDSSPPVSSKKQKVSGQFSDQSIEQLNDVTAVSGVNLREEEEQLFSGSKEDCRVSETSRMVVQEEEERLILQKIPLKKRLAEIMSRYRLKNINDDAERCLSLCVEERMRGLISNLIRLSKQRVDDEKSRHQSDITSVVQQQIMRMNQKAREEWDKKQSEVEKLRKVNEPEDDNEVEVDNEKDDSHAKSVKTNRDEDDKMRTTAANVAARAAVGGDDMLSKWQLMAEQARQRREGGNEATSSSQSAKDVGHNPRSTSGRNMKDNQEPEKRSSAAASRAARNLGKNQVMQISVARTISVKDVIAVLEREPQMSKSNLICRLHERTGSGAQTK